MRQTSFLSLNVAKASQLPAFITSPTKYHDLHLQQVPNVRATQLITSCADQAAAGPGRRLVTCGKQESTSANERTRQSIPYLLVDEQRASPVDGPEEKGDFLFRFRTAMEPACRHGLCLVDVRLSITWRALALPCGALWRAVPSA